MYRNRYIDVHTHEEMIGSFCLSISLSTYAALVNHGLLSFRWSEKNTDSNVFLSDFLLLLLFLPFSLSLSLSVSRCDGTGI
ncbi:hypothetical protein CSUI_005639 [Cystoisospora suis]|uniref:Transmembrane protein n=1 Tax=Cystoisospora suis TaxID=483139 RepID=A0A2C6KT26_9APIC|nr:hypothetical protein CSUI_005639 [Cystoisospora suis]